MAQSRGPQVFAPPNPYYWQQQQNWGGQVGTRGVGGQQGQPLSPEDFGAQGQPGVRGQPGVGVQGQGQQQPGVGFQGQGQQQPGVGFQGQMGPQPGVGMPEQMLVNLSPQEKEALQEALDILKEGRAALATRAIDGEVAQRLTAAHAYVAGFLEARGLGELGSYLSTIPQVTTRGSVIDNPADDQMIDNLDRFLGDETQTRWIVPALNAALTIGTIGYDMYKSRRKKKR